MSFESELRCGRLRIPECPSCARQAWPPAPACPACGKPTRLGPAVEHGTVLERSSDAEGHFCLLEVGPGARILCRIRGHSAPKHGQKAALAGCGVGKDGAYFFEAALIS